jgi:uncharacterized protein (DUF1800 family)
VNFLWTISLSVESASARAGAPAALLGAFVAEAIRPHVTGRFVTMLLAVMRHPAMLLYLDNVGSIGPRSRAGLRTHRGLNENLARECLELHTLSPAAGYTQDDVTALARILTGWSIELQAEPLGFRFRPAAHEPGAQALLGQSFDPDEAGGIAAQQFLADHPSTHHFLATKLVRHFVADTPPPAAVRRIESVLRDTRGDLGAASAALVALDDAWQPGAKLRMPQEFVLAGFRALDIPTDEAFRMTGAFNVLGQPLWTAPAPNGWPDQAADWSAPEAMIRRIDWANGIAGRIGTRDPLDLADAVLGPLLRPATQMAMAHAASRRDATTLLLTSPEFQRR